jgi:5-methyltetrahydrofolate--homocysteine methyltransferase
VKVVPDIPIAELWPLLDLNELYRLQWGAKNAKGEEYEALKRGTFEPKLAELKAQCEAEGWLQPKAVYGYFPARSAVDAVVVFDVDDQSREIARFDFPRQAGAPYLCLSDYVAAERTDVLPLQVVTVGPRATEVCEALNKAGDYSLSYYLHGLSVEVAEAAAEWMHRRIAADLGIPAGQGHRYSWGYPACPDLEQHHILFNLLAAAEALGMEVTDAGQLVPDQSTAALVIHHPEAIYFGAV